MALPGYLEDTAKDYAKQATATYGTITTFHIYGATICCRDKGSITNVHYKRPLLI